MGKTIVVDHHEIELSHPEKILYPQEKITKENIVEYYQKVAPQFIPHVKNRCIVMRRYPDGISHESFFQKEMPDYFPSWMPYASVHLKKGGNQNLVLIEKAADLVYLANQAVLEFHAWLSTADKPDYPNKIVFDLDPHGKAIEDLRFAAHEIKKMLEEHKLKPFVMTTGSRGYHVVASIKQTHNFKAVHDFTKEIANTLSKKYPEKFTTEMTKSEREGKVFIDYLRNSYGQTSVAPYSLRAHPGAPIATPLDWDELSSTLPQKYTIDNIFRRLGVKEDPWHAFEKSAKELKL